MVKLSRRSPMLAGLAQARERASAAVARISPDDRPALCVE
jgi:hypothetical protein